MTQDNQRYQLIWKAGFNNTNNRIVIGSPNLQTLLTQPKGYNEAANKRSIKAGKPEESVSNVIPVNNVDFVQAYLKFANTHDIVIPFNTSICLAQEYSPQITNKIASYSTLGGNSVVSFGQGIKKIGMKISIIKAGAYWIPYNAALEALTVISGQSSRYLGSLFLNGFDLANTSKARKYKVVVESLTPSFRSDRNTTIDYDLNMIVVYDYSSERIGKWGKL